MRGQPDLFGEIPEDEIVKIARKAAEERGYAIYADFNEYMGQKMAQRGLKPTGGGWYLFFIQKALEGARWKRETEHWPTAHWPTRFYPPSTESPNLGRRQDDTTP